MGATWSPRMKKLTKYTTSWPKMMANWFQLTSMPRILEGAISPMYMGHTAEASPTPIPPMTRYRLKTMSSVMSGLPSGRIIVSGHMEPQAEMKNITPAKIRLFLRPHWEASMPEMPEPMIQPIRALLLVKPCQKSVY